MKCYVKEAWFLLSEALITFEIESYFPGKKKQRQHWNENPPEILHELPKFAGSLGQWHNDINKCVSHIDIFIFHFHYRTEWPE